MSIDETDFEELLPLLQDENAPSAPTEARQAVENFVDLVELLMKPLPLPPAGSSSLTQASLDHPGQASVSQSHPLSAEEVQGHD